MPNRYSCIPSTAAARFQIAVVWLLVFAAAAVVQAAYPPADPAATLELLLRDVWQQGADKAYVLYMSKKRVPMSAAAQDAFASSLLELAKSPAVAAIVIQSGSKAYRNPELPSPDAINHSGFIHFVRKRQRAGAVTERIYINAHPDHAADIMRFVVGELFEPDVPSADAEVRESSVRRHSIGSCKVADPAGLERRADSILIYAAAETDVVWALHRLREFASIHEEYFLADIPAGTRPQFKGVSTAAEPAASLKAGSFGTYLAQVAQAALKESPVARDFETFRGRARALMWADGVDPDHPDRLTRGGRSAETAAAIAP